MGGVEWVEIKAVELIVVPVDDVVVLAVEGFRWMAFVVVVNK